MSNNRNTYDMLVAILTFKEAYKNLTAASIKLPDLDLSAGYPFYLLDFEEIAPAVSQWCSIHAASLMSMLPNRVINPVCIHCEHVGQGISSSGMCKGNATCQNYPLIVFTPEAVLPVLTLFDKNQSSVDSTTVLLAYMKLLKDKGIDMNAY